MDILQQQMETESFLFEIGNYKFFEKDDNGYYIVAEMMLNEKGFVMYYFKEYSFLVDRICECEGREYFEYILLMLQEKLTQK